MNFDGVVNIFDINLVSAHWGDTGPSGDANGDTIVNIFDINLISANWTPSPGAGAAVVRSQARSCCWGWLVRIPLLGRGRMRK